MDNVKKIFKHWKLITFGVPLLCGGVAATCLGIKKANDERLTAQAQKLGMMIQHGNALHLGKGTYTLKFTKSFADEMFDGVDEDDRKMAIGGILRGIQSFNDISENVKFEVSSETDKLAKYGILKKQSNGKFEIYVNISEEQKSKEVAEVELLAGNGGQIYDANLTYVKHYLFGVWQDYGTENLDKTLAPENTIVATSTQHELNHIMGFADDYSKNRKYTIMRYDLSENTQNYTSLDKYKVAYANYLFADGKKPNKSDFMDENEQEYFIEQNILQ